MTENDRPIPRGPHKLWAEIIEGRRHPAIDAITEQLLLDLHRRTLRNEKLLELLWKQFADHGHEGGGDDR